MSMERSNKGLRRSGAAMAVGALLLLGNIAPAIGASYTVRATDDDTWRPKTKEIFKDDKIVWRNPTDSPHNVKAYGGNWNYSSGTLSQGDSASKRFRSRGTFKYRCEFHSDMDNGVCEGMCGKIRVVRRP